MDKRIIVYEPEDFEGAKILHLREISFNRKFTFSVVEISKLTDKSVIFSPNSEISGTRKGRPYFGVLSFFQSFFLVREGQTVEEAIAEVVKAYEVNTVSIIANLRRDIDGIKQAQEEYIN